MMQQSLYTVTASIGQIKMHADSHPLHDRVVILNINTIPDQRRNIMPGVAFKVVDWWDRKNGHDSYIEAMLAGDILARQYSMRSGDRLPEDENVVIGYIGRFIYVVHESEIGGVWE